MVKPGSKEAFAHSLGWVQQIPLSPGGDLVPCKKEQGSVPLEDLLRIKGSLLCMRLNELQRGLRECSAPALQRERRPRPQPQHSRGVT